MSVPSAIPIARDPHRTETIGRYAGGQFFAWMTYAFRGRRPIHLPGWEEDKRLYVVLHRFDGDGRHTDSDIWFAGTWAEVQRNGRAAVFGPAEARLSKLLEGLPGREYGDIAIRPFELTFDGVLFGLVAHEHDGIESAEFHPMGIVFYPPWDGLYST